MRGWLWLIVLLLGVSGAGAHMHDRPDLNDWFTTLKKGNNICCSLSDQNDGHLVPVEDYVTQEEFASHHCRRAIADESDKDQGPFTYCAHIHWTFPVADYDAGWWLVPDRVIVHVPNRYGEALAFLVWSWDGNNRVVSFFRCFLPGAGI